jgi:hypothetical protein
MSNPKQYHAVWDRDPFNHHEAVCIRTPQGKEIAFIWFSREPDAEAAAHAMANAMRICDALNAYTPASATKPSARRSRKYYATLDRNGTEDEITITSPAGEELAYIWFWDDPESTYVPQAMVDAMLMVNALNAYKPKAARKR